MRQWQWSSRALVAILPSEEILCNNLKSFHLMNPAEYALGADIRRFLSVGYKLQNNGQSAVMLMRCGL
jgi:hypothetical protein